MTVWTIPDDLPRILLDPAPGPPSHKLRDAWAIQVASKILRAAINYFRPVRVFACFSGGYDSVVPVCHTLQHVPDAKVLHINTGIGIESTREYVRLLCEQRGWPLVEAKTTESYEEFVLAHGFPGPGQHHRMYQRLKERPIRDVMREEKSGHHRNSCVMFVSGIRHDESARRTGYQKCISKVDSQVWVNPWYWADAWQFDEYRKWHGIPRNPVKDTLGMSGECLCGAYAEKGELSRVEMACPETAAYIRELEERVRAAGHDWGWEDPGPPACRRSKGQSASEGIYVPDEDDYRPMCHNCDKIHEVKVEESINNMRRVSDFLERLRRAYP